MAFPVIQFNTSTGSDTQASGAGPSTALFGTTDASTDGTGLVVTLTAGTNLSGVSTTGSDVLFLNDSTAGKRNFGKITGTAGSGGATPTVTVADAFDLSISGKSWAIGGKRNTLSAATNLKLFENNAANGDAMPGWVIELAGSQTHAFTAALTIRRAGNLTDGPITLRTAAGFSARAILTWNNNGIAINPITACASWYFVDLELQNTNGTKTAAFAFVFGTGGFYRLLRIKCADPTNKFGRFISGVTGNNVCVKLLYCEVGYCTLANAISWGNFFLSGLIAGCWFHDNTGSGTISLGTASNWLILWNLFTNNTGNCIVSSVIASGGGGFIIGNTADASSGDFLTMTAGGSESMNVLDNLLTNCTGTGVDFGADTAERLATNNTLIDGNNTFNNSGGSYSPSGYGTNDPGVDPGYVNTGALNWGVGSAMAALGFPLTVFPGSTTRSYMDIGAAQRQGTSSAGGISRSRAVNPQ